MRNPLTNEAFAEWCEKQPADKGYDYVDDCGCAFFQYLKATGFDVLTVSSTDWYERGTGRRHNLPRGADDAVSAHPRSFGDLAARLRSSS